MRRILIISSIVFVACKEVKSNKAIKEPIVEEVQQSKEKLFLESNSHISSAENTQKLSAKKVEKEYPYESKKTSKIILKNIDDVQQSKEKFFLVDKSNIHITLPESIQELSVKKVEQRYIYESRRPSKIFLKKGDPSYEFNLNYKIDKGSNTLEQFQKTYTKLYKARKIEILSNEIRYINGKEFLYMKMLMPPQSVNNSKVDEISHFFMTFVDTKTLIGSIRYASVKDGEYEGESLECLNSISFK